MRLLLPNFTQRGAGCVINMASRAGTIDMPFNTAYSVSKAALIRLTSCVQEELKVAGHHDIHLYALHPGAIASNLTAGKIIFYGCDTLMSNIEQNQESTRLCSVFQEC